jgi:phospholipid/cholesterol/gamma-HCH transport system substrate-binding protein
MEDRAKFVLIGLFTFAVIAGAFGFVYWLHANTGNKESTSYRVIFDGSVTGLRIGAPVLFNGIRVGEVTNLQLTKDPSEVAALLSVENDTPVRSDTRVTLEFSGLTGIASVSLKGVLASSPPLKAKDGEMPTLKAESNAGQDLSSAVRETLGRADAVIAANQESLHKAIKNIEVFTDALARNSDKIDSIVSHTDTMMTNANDLVATSKDTMESIHKLSDNLDKRTASITVNVNKVMDSANKQINIVGADAHRAINNIDRAVTDLAKHPSRFLFGGSQ